MDYKENINQILNNLCTYEIVCGLILEKYPDADIANFDDFQRKNFYFFSKSYEYESYSLMGSNNFYIVSSEKFGNHQEFSISHQTQDFGYLSSTDENGNTSNCEFVFYSNIDIFTNANFLSSSSLPIFAQDFLTCCANNNVKSLDFLHTMGNFIINLNQQLEESLVFS